MRLESALYSSREGLTSQGQAIAVVGDNISNSNTTGYKYGRVEFSDLMPGGPDGTQHVTEGEAGGGSTVSRVRSMVNENGILEPTGRDLDVGVAGLGFFIVQNGTNELYTRAGNFTISDSGALVDQNGYNVMGYKGTDTGSLTSIDMLGLDMAASPSTKIALTGNLDASAAIGTAPTAPATYDEISAKGAAAFSANISAYDSLGKAHSVLVAFTKTANQTWTAQAYVDGGDISGGTAGTPKLVGTLQNLVFNTDGTIDAANKAASVMQVTGVAYANGAASGSFALDLGGYNQYSAASVVNSVVNDGQSTGNIKTYEIESDGKVFAVLDSGSRKQVGSIALKTFSYTDGLDRAGNALYTFSGSSGANAAGLPGSEGRGDLQSASLERSTVDISHEFVDLVLYQRAYQASSQTLNAANTMLRDTLGLIR